MRLMKFIKSIKIIIVGYAKELQMALSEETSGYYRNFLMQLLLTNRHNNATDKFKTYKLANILKSFVDKNDFELVPDMNKIFASESYEQLTDAFSQYAEICGNSVQNMFSFLPKSYRRAINAFGKLIWR